MKARDGLREVHFEHLGVTLKTRRIPQMLVQDWHDGLPKPPPVPKQEVDYGDGKKIMEENPSHPSYGEALQAYNYQIGMRAIEFAIQRGVVVDVDKEAVKELRDWAAAQQPPITLPQDDKVLFVSRILLTDMEDLVQLRGEVFGRFMPTEEEIDRSVKRFRTEVPRS